MLELLHETARSKRAPTWLALTAFAVQCAWHEPTESRRATNAPNMDLASRSSATLSEPAPPLENRSMDIPLWQTARSAKMSVFFPKRDAPKPRPALVVFRGGAYATSSGSGAGSAEWLASQGIVGAVGPYRTQSTGDAYPAGDADAARAVPLIRNRAADLNVDPA